MKRKQLPNNKNKKAKSQAKAMCIKGECHIYLGSFFQNASKVSFMPVHLMLRSQRRVKGAMKGIFSENQIQILNTGSCIIQSPPAQAV